MIDYTKNINNNNNSSDEIQSFYRVYLGFWRIMTSTSESKYILKIKNCTKNEDECTL